MEDIMDFKEMETAALEERLANIVEESADEQRSLDELNAMETEVQAIKAELESRKADEAERRALAEKVAAGAGKEVNANEPEKENRTMENMEIRNSKQYIDAFAEYVKSADDKECRALLTENVEGSVPVPTFIYDIVKTAWDRDEITRRVRKAYLRGNIKIGFEVSASPAEKHTESATTAVTEEELVLGTIELIPVSFKKWISISDEVYDMRGEAFLRYIYDELTYQIAKAVANDLLDQIVACGPTAGDAAVSVQEITASDINVGIVAQAIASLSDEAANPVIVMNKATWGAFKAAQAANGFNYDPFEGLPIAFSNHLPAFSTASSGDTFMIVGDFYQGALANFPGGEEITIKFDDKTLMEKDLIRILGREYVAIGPVACDAFVKVMK